MTEYKIQKVTLDGIANAINAKTGGTAPIDAADMEDAIANIPSGGGGTAEHGVFFLDYDGSFVDVWETDTVAAKTALPSNPSHTGLVAQGWNWDLQHIKDYIAAYENADVYVGQMYKTASGLTEIAITVTKAMSLTVTCNMVGNKNWGDGTENALTEHTYADYGDYTITCDGNSIPKGSSNSGGLFGTTSSNMNRYWCTAIRIGGNVTSIGTYAFANCNSIKSITIPQGITSIKSNAFLNCYFIPSITIPQSVTSIEGNAFYCCYSLKTITIPQSVTSIGSYAFYLCCSIPSITIPQGVTSIESNAFYYCYSLNTITIPQGVTGISSNALRNCYSLNSITIPKSVTSIDGNAFAADVVLVSYDFASATSVPTLSNTNAFTNISGLCKIIVPDALYDTWIAATNWATYADYIYKASEVAA